MKSRHDKISLERRLTEISRHGHDEMPPIYITGEEIRDLTAYIQTVEPDDPTDAADLPTGEQTMLSPVAAQIALVTPVTTAALPARGL